MKIPVIGGLAGSTISSAAALARGKFEDQEDLVIMQPDPVAEKCPTCDSVGELRQLIRDWKGGRLIKYAFVHCTASHQTATVQSILDYWHNVRKWTNPGYHIIVTPEKGWTLLQPFELPSNGVLGWNQNSVNISYIGGIDAKGKPLDNRTALQKEIIRAFLSAWKERDRTIQIFGHRDKAAKACPSYDAKKEYASL